MAPAASLSPQGEAALISRLQRICNYPSWANRIADVDHWLSHNIGLTAADCAAVLELFGELDITGDSLGRDELSQLLTALTNGLSPTEKG